MMDDSFPERLASKPRLTHLSELLGATMPFLYCYISTCSFLPWSPLQPKFLNAIDHHA